MIKENKKDAGLKTAQTMVIKYMYNGRLHVGVLFCQLNNMCRLIFFS